MRIVTIQLLAGDTPRDVLVQTKFEPPLAEWEQDDPIVEAAAVALGAISNYAAGLEH